MLSRDRMDPSTDLVEHFKLDVVLFPDHTRHTFYHSDGRQNRRKVKVVKNWIKQHELGEGGGGTVCLEKDSNGDERAVKEISKSFCLRNRIDYKKEITAMAKLTKHPELFVELHGWFDDDTRVFLAMEYFKHGDLQNFMDSPFPERDVGIITRQLLQGLNVMHKHGFTHRDLKPQNIFVVAEFPTWWVKIGDFGIAKRIMDDQTALRTEVGTRDYQAPEVFGFTDSEEELLYTSAVDLWALGCVMYRLLTLEKPFPKPSSLRLYCYSMKDFPVEPLYAKDVSENAVEFIRQLMRVHPPERLDAETALKSDWLSLQEGSSDSETDSIAEEKVAAEIPVHEGNTLPTQAIATASRKDNRSGTENDTASGSSREVTVVSHAPQSERVVKFQRGRLPRMVPRKNQKSEVDFDQEWFLPGFDLDDKDDKDEYHENHIASNVDTLNLVTKAASDITDQGEGLGEHPDLPVCLETSESDITLEPPPTDQVLTAMEMDHVYGLPPSLRQPGGDGALDTPGRLGSPTEYTGAGGSDEAKILTSTKAICPTCYFEGGPKRQTSPAESMAAMVYCETHKYMVEQDTATLKQLHRAGYFLDVRTISADLSTELDATKALHWAAKSGCFRALKYLLDRGVNPCAIDNEERSQKQAALHYAASGGCTKEVDVLIEKGADVQALDAASWSPLHYAAAAGYCTISEALLKAGASVNSLNFGQEMPLHYAARGGFAKLVDLLIKKGADVQALDAKSWSPLHHAATSGECRINEALLKAGASVHLLNLSLETPLHCAARMGNRDVIKLLLDWGADISAEDVEGFTPFGRARKANSRTIEALRPPAMEEGSLVFGRLEDFKMLSKRDPIPKRSESGFVGKLSTLWPSLFRRQDRESDS